ncbi:Cps19aC [[Clostridium] sordellii]|uniref:Capsular polysaccharide biosynthesis protein n=1 Tax=Paraclostridium sordellii TaxID=1505 RepID=A0ABM9RRI1_PARSO|nr:MULTISPECIES: Wzz/FepE/Etk N-terminal domain-containing protein [Paeniclostridium]MBW4863515.1 lipopolysaccharide biosynthesis protein [Paeniclostridium sp.]MBW4873163.1 lipopolysaccharide biosynthesis protein [Paeniclostridium sp.]MCQ4697349.1 Wzz/FepE/Etk N-terminal domain-containing protein [Paeniclostridium sordellii]MDU2149145.1 Wzz/FepE/Etk N-terminal domain-containing protein [Paeniclostridium sordellii]MDU4413665.1 Wzz/FepE/Etk N-terminal domain-containing protein [Paeniclostridium 
MEETIDLREYFHIIKKRAWIIALITILAMVTSGIISFFVLSPVYEANTTLIVNTEQNKSTNNMITGDQLAVTQKLTLTYGEIIKSRSVLNSVIKKLDLNMDYEDLEKSIKVSQVKDTQIMSITVQSTNPKIARDIANSIPTVFSKEVKRITKANSVEVIDKAITPENPVKPNKTINIAISAILGFIVGVFIVFVLEYMDNKIKSPQDIEKYIDLPILGVIPNENMDKKGGRK